MRNHYHIACDVCKTWRSHNIATAGRSTNLAAKPDKRRQAPPSNEDFQRRQAPPSSEDAQRRQASPSSEGAQRRHTPPSSEDAQRRCCCYCKDQQSKDQQSRDQQSRDQQRTDTRLISLFLCVVIRFFVASPRRCLSMRARPGNKRTYIFILHFFISHRSRPRAGVGR